MSGNMVKGHKLLVTVVKKGLAKKIVKASKAAGAEGGTILMGIGTGSQECESIFGFTIEPEKEIILTLIEDDKLQQVMSAVVAEGNLEKSCSGMAFVISLASVAGICHLCAGGTLRRDSRMVANEGIQYDLIVTIVNKGHSEKVVEASKKAGAEGGTILFGRGTGIHEQAKLFGITIEPEKELVLTLIKNSLTEQVLSAIVTEAQLDKPGKGIAFILGVEQVAGINHMVNN